MSKPTKPNKYSYSEITSVLKSLIGGPRVSNDRFTYYTKTTNIIIRGEKGTKVRSDVYEAATKATTPQALEMIETAKLVFKTKNETKFSTTTPVANINRELAIVTPISFSAINAVLIGILGGAKAPVADFLAVMHGKGGQDGTPILYRHQPKTTKGKTGLRLRNDIYTAAKHAAKKDTSATELIANADLVWNSPETAYSKFTGTPVTLTPITEVATISE